jgi:hypothetical protein
MPQDAAATLPRSSSSPNAAAVKNPRARALADRIEKGAAGLAAFAETLTEAEWKVPVTATDRRPVGVIVHHVAMVYPIEVDIATAIAKGGDVPGVRWEDIAALNAGHANENAGVTKTAALDLLKANSRKAAEGIRALSDEELDRSAPIPLYENALLTAQFFIEDHALRHSWHHLGRIRRAVGR